MGPEINSKSYHEVAPVISTDGKKLYFVVNDHPQNTYGLDHSQDIWFSTLDEKGQWAQAKRMGAPLNQNRYNQVFSVLPDGSLFVRGGRGKNSKGFSIVSPGGSWNELPIKDFENMDKGTFNGGSISADGKRIICYFSEAPGSKRSDLYLSTQQSDGNWSRPEKIMLSTVNDEFGPFISPDQTTLYFASDRIATGRIGGVDIYKSTRLEDTWKNWSQPVNAGRAVNTTGGDAYFSLDAAGNVFTCRMGALIEGGNYDLFMLKPKDVKVMLNVSILNEKTQQPLAAAVEVKAKDQILTLKPGGTGKFDTRLPEVESYSVNVSANGFIPKDQTLKMPKIKGDTTLRLTVSLTPIARKLIVAGNVFDKKTQQPMNAKLTIVSQENKANNFQIEAAGKFEQEVSSLGSYLLTASADGYLNGIDTASLMDENQSPARKDLYLTPIEVGLTVRLKNIYFDFDKTTLKSESYTELNRVVDFLKKNSKIEIQIEGHTDNKGSDEYNTNLSQGRSQSVVDYLIQQGIDGNRLKAKGFGESKPIESNDTEEGRANNRRVEFTVVKT
jgi:outer membrane protein OmpA-like peptidoglycan-associated protein